MSIVLAPPLLAELLLVLLLLLLVPLLQPTAAKAMTINAAIAVVRPIVFLSILGCPAATEHTEGTVAPVRLSSAAAPGQGADAVKPQCGQGGDRLSGVDHLPRLASHRRDDPCFVGLEEGVSDGVGGLAQLRLPSIQCGLGRVQLVASGIIGCL